MSGWLKLVPTWVWLAIVLGLCALVGLQQIRVSVVRTDLADYRADVAERDRRAAVAALAETKRRQQAVEGVEKDAQEKLGQAQSDADHAGSALQRLQQRYAEAEQRARQCGNTVTAPLSAAAEGEARMRAELLGHVGAAAGFYAAADENRIRGQACEAAYDSLKQ